MFSEQALSAVMLEAASRARIGVMVTDREGEVLHLVYVSQVAAELLGSTREALLVRDAKMLLVERLRSEALRVSNAVRSGQPMAMPFELAVRREDGTELAAEFGVTPMEVDGRVYMVIFFWSVQARREAEDQARALDALYRNVIEGAPDGVVISRRGAVLWANPSAARMLGLPGPEALVGTDLAAIMPPEEAAEMRQRVQRTMQHGERLPAREYRARRADGSDLVAEITSIPFRWEGAPATLAFARDVSERSRAQTSLAQTDRLAALGTLAAGVAHEINNPMAAVLFGIEGVERMLRRPALDEKTRADLLGLLADLKRGAERVTQIVKDLRVFSRGGDESTTPTDLKQVVEVAERLAGHAVRERASLFIDLGHTPPVRGNLARLEQVVVNLLINAAQAMPEGKDRMLNVVSVTARTEPAHVSLVVEDNGSGIPAEVLPRVFEPFFTTKPVGVGTGLGLSICHGIVQQLGGELTVASPPGKGATFTIRLVRADI